MEKRLPKQYLPFEVDGISYAVPVAYVEFLVSTAMHFPCCVMPHSPPHVRYVMRCGGVWITVVELSQLINGTECSEYPARALLLILSYHGKRIGLLIDRANPLLELSNPRVEQAKMYASDMLLCETGNYILYDVPSFYAFMCSGKEGCANQMP